ncbi:hypothetical protein O9X90_23395 [Agrobacterium leguminum]|uniref:hypothetical protein n=1 Tax=Agrobacterium leguminum TaxID=2792015 RepID=UPI0022B825F5|nr:hypothetical protein [Agrobacterium leguminum]MCZ7935279.1 hypothetical protein [Agrobacterium leguminum]
MLRNVFIASLVLGSSWAISDARAQSTVEYQSRHNQYGECWIGSLSKSQLILQISGSPCILNRTWRDNSCGKYIRVAQGCPGIFDDFGSCHRGRDDTFDPNARMYDHRGHDVGAVVVSAPF